jgi:probable FeS assembly SUF system protein SufT
MGEPMTPRELLDLKRSCDAIEIPSGRPHLLREGTRVKVMQNLGDSYTVMTELGQMLRIDAKDADALGVTSSQAAETPVDEFSEKQVWDQLKTIHDPEIPVNIVDLGLIYSCDITHAEDRYKIDVKMTLTAPGCGMADVLRVDVERKLAKLPQVKEVLVEVVFDPPWQPSRMSEAAKLQLGLDLDSGSGLSIYLQR